VPQLAKTKLGSKPLVMPNLKVQRVAARKLARDKEKENRQQLLQMIAVLHNNKIVFSAKTNSNSDI